jgi:hypothetical protein
MLSVLQFKRSLFAGVLDGGDKDVFVGESRFNKFMESVEAATSAIPEAMIEDAEDALRTLPDVEAEPRPASDDQRPSRGKRGRRPRAPVPGRERKPAEIGALAESDDDLVATGVVAAPSGDPWANLLQAGMAVLQQVTSVAREESAQRRGAARPGDVITSLIQRDDRTGETYLKLPMPAPDVLEQALKLLGSWLSSAPK